MHTSGHFVQWKLITLCNTGLEAMALWIIIGVSGNVLTMDANTEATSGSRNNAMMTEYSRSLFCVV